VQEGKCYSLFTRQAHDARMPRYQVPEIMRVPLEELVLQIHFLALGQAGDFLQEVLQPPPEKAVAAAVATLQVLGALDELERLTPLGHHLAQLPMEPRLGKLLVTSILMGCLSGALTIAVCLSYQTPFLTAFQVHPAAPRALEATGTRPKLFLGEGLPDPACRRAMHPLGQGIMVMDETNPGYSCVSDSNSCTI
jgi:HrpA-like RNA helicase